MEDRTQIDEMLEKAKAAQSVVETYTQEQVDALVKIVGKTIFDNAEILAEEAVSEHIMDEWTVRFISNRRLPQRHGTIFGIRNLSELSIMIQ